MPRKPKLQQKGTPDTVSGRDLFQTPNYATEILIPFLPDGVQQIWECAAGDGKIAKVLECHGYRVLTTDLRGPHMMNFLTTTMSFPFDCIITNPPFSLKSKFYERCIEYNVPFALLIPADYSGWTIKAMQDGAEKIVPTRRIDYITPNGRNGKSSQSQFHSMWLTSGLGLGRSETFVDLSLDMKRNI